jgi:hypothetical protein
MGKNWMARFWTASWNATHGETRKPGAILQVHRVEDANGA